MVIIKHLTAGNRLKRFEASSAESLVNTPSSGGREGPAQVPQSDTPVFQACVFHQKADGKVEVGGGSVGGVRAELVKPSSTCVRLPSLLIFIFQQEGNEAATAGSGDFGEITFLLDANIPHFFPVLVSVDPFIISTFRLKVDFIKV